MIDSTNKFVCKVSSTINKEVKNFGKQFMFDQNDETCWNSDEGEMQWVLLKYDKIKKISTIEIQFQGGFGAKQCTFECLNDNGVVEHSEDILFENNNLKQFRTLPQSLEAKIFKLNFIDCYDTYGRIIIYNLNFK